MAKIIKVGIDIGTSQVKVAVAEASNEEERRFPHIIGVGVSESRGMRHGYITNQSEISNSIKRAIAQAEKNAGVKIKKAYVAIGGIGLSALISHGSIMISRADSEITELDVEKAIVTSERDLPKSATINRKIIHTIPLEYKVDGKHSLGRPIGLKGMRLEVKTLFIFCLEHHINDLVQAVEEAGVSVEDVTAAPFAAALVTLTKLQKMAGCVLANIGAETVSIVVYENNLPTSLEVFQLGSTDITNDIALGLKIPIEEAESIKLGRTIDTSYPRKKLEEIIEARLSDIFELIEHHLKKIGRSALLPAGIILSGGGAGLTNLADFAKVTLKLPSKVATFTGNTNTKTPIKDATWAVAYGLCLISFNTGEDETFSGTKMIRRTGQTFKGWFKQFLP